MLKFEVKRRATTPTDCVLKDVLDLWISQTQKLVTEIIFIQSESEDKRRDRKDGRHARNNIHSDFELDKMTASAN